MRSLIAALLIAAIIPLASAEEVIKIGVIGTGGRGTGAAANALTAAPNVHLIAMADPFPDRIEKSLKTLKESRELQGGLLENIKVKDDHIFTGLDCYKKLLETDVDYVILTEPPGFRPPHFEAAIEAGAHVYIEKPLTEYPAEADDILAAAKKKGLKVSVAHVKRYMDQFLLMKKLLDQGYLGDVLGVRFQGKQDSRVGGEDLIVLGSHDMDMMRFFFGDPRWCFASVTADGRDITKQDIRKGREPYTVAGDTIRADYMFDNNIQCRWCSVKGSENWNQSYRHGDKSLSKWGFDIFGSKRILSHQESIGTYVLDFPFITPVDPPVQWRPLEELGNVTKPDYLSHPIRNLIYAIENDTKPQCSGEDARWAVEMVCAVYHSQRKKAQIPFPLEERGHPLRDYY